VIPAKSRTLLDEQELKVRLAPRQRQCAKTARQAAAGDDQPAQRPNLWEGVASGANG